MLEPHILPMLKQCFIPFVSVMVALIFGIWALKRFQCVAFPSQKAIKMTGCLNLGGHQKLILVEYGGEEHLIGISAQHIQRIAVQSLKQDSNNTDNTLQKKTSSWIQACKKSFRR